MKNVLLVILSVALAFSSCNKARSQEQSIPERHVLASEVTVTKVQSGNINTHLAYSCFIKLTKEAQDRLSVLLPGGVGSNCPTITFVNGSDSLEMMTQNMFSSIYYDPCTFYIGTGDDSAFGTIAVMADHLPELLKALALDESSFREMLAEE